MNQWAERKRWAARFMPETKAILGAHLIADAPLDEDQDHGTDLIVLKLDSVRIACRHRRNRYLKKYGREFTIRYKSPRGGKTELSKVIEGWGDYVFYAFANEREDTLCQWIIGDLKVFRLWFSRRMYALGGKFPGDVFDNPDGSRGIAFVVSDLPREFLLASSYEMVTT